MPILCIDIGNTFAHVGLVQDGHLLERTNVATTHFIAADADARSAVEIYAARSDGISWASVVPKASEGLLTIFDGIAVNKEIFNLRYDTLRGLGIEYPYPEEIGQDRLANSVAAQELCGLPCVVVSMGTATVLDVMTKGGYAGGIIAPGLAVMTDYLHEKTAQLPKLDCNDLSTNGSIGHSTTEAMKIGARLGFAGMVKEMLAAVLAELEATGQGKAAVITTGGNAGIFPENLCPGARHVRGLSLLGLEVAFRRAKA